MAEQAGRTKATPPSVQDITVLPSGAMPSANAASASVASRAISTSSGCRPILSVKSRAVPACNSAFRSAALRLARTPRARRLRLAAVPLAEPNVAATGDKTSIETTDMSLTRGPERNHRTGNYPIPYTTPSLPTNAIFHPCRWAVLANHAEIDCLSKNSWACTCRAHVRALKAGGHQIELSACGTYIETETTRVGYPCVIWPL